MRDRVAAEEAVEGTGSVQPRTAAPEFATTLPIRLLALQRSVGNRAVNRILARDAWSEAVKYDKWMEAAKSLGGATDKDVNDRLGQLNLGQLGGLLGGTREWGTNQAGETVWDQKTNLRIRELIYAHRKKRSFVTFAAAGKVPTGKLGSVIKRSNDAGMQIELYFLPDADKVTAGEIAFVQSVRRLKPDGSVDREHEQAYAARPHDRQRLAGRRVRGGHLRLLRDEGRRPDRDHVPLVQDHADPPRLHARHRGHHRATGASRPRPCRCSWRGTRWARPTARSPGG